jgi:hypothetical protein
MMSLRLQFEGYGPGLYVRIEMSHIPYKMVEFFNPRYPVIASGLIPCESAWLRVDSVQEAPVVPGAQNKKSYHPVGWLRTL